MGKKVQEEPSRRKTRVGLLAIIAAFTGFAVVSSLLGAVVTGPLTVEAQPGSVLPTDASIEDAIPAPAVSASPAGIAVAATTEIFDAPDVMVVPPPPPPPPVKKTGRRPGGGTTNPGGGYKSYEDYCLAPERPYSTGSGDPSALLSLVNQERARIGLSGLSWSGGLAGTAQSWSQSMAAADDATPGVPGDALAHNPSRPSGGENVAMNWSSAGYSTTQSMNIAHSGWVYSFGHCKNLLRPSWTIMGAGGAQSAEGVWYWTENFQ